MTVATVTTKGQVTIPADIRQRFDITAGDQLAFYPSLEGDLKIHVRKPGIGSGAGLIAARGRHVAVREMDPGRRSSDTERGG